MHHDQLRALLAVVEEGTFEAAARRLHVTPSAVSQRIRALESATGRVVVQRGTPCRATEAGTVLLRAARQVQLVEQEVAAALEGPEHGRAVLAVAVNADSLATWFRPVLGEAGGWDDAVLRLRVEDQQLTDALLAKGEVMAAVTEDPVAVSGCSVRPLGAMRYLPLAVPDLVERFSRDGRVDLAAMPVVDFNAKDALQQELLTARGGLRPPVHEVPSSEAFLAAVLAGLGWGMVPEHQLGDALTDGRLVRVARGHRDVPLYWQRWRLASAQLDRLSEAVSGAATGLRRVSARAPR